LCLHPHAWDFYPVLIPRGGAYSAGLTWQVLIRVR